MVLSRFFSSQEVLQSQSCRPTLHVGLHQRLYLTLKSKWPTQLLHMTSSCQKGTPNTHIWPHPVRKAQYLYSTMCKNNTSERLSTYIRPHPVRKAQHLQWTMLESTVSKWISTYNLTMHEAPHQKGLSTYNLTMHKALHQKGLSTYILTMQEAPH